MATLRQDPAGFDRRILLAGAAAVLTMGFGPRQIVSGVARLRSIETSANGRLGAYVLDPDRRTGFGWREHERFAHCSSFKLSLAAMTLAKGERGEIDLAEILRWTRQDLLPVSPVTTASIDTGLSIEKLAQATQVMSDNTAANVLLRHFGGPAALTAFWRSLGDKTSRLDRYEPALNAVPPGTELDTTTPAAMAATVSALVNGDVLKPASRARLKGWMAETRTGMNRLRAGFPAAWQSGDKTGTGIGDRTHTYVDIAFGGPVGRTPLIVAAYFEPARLAEPMDPIAIRALADVGRAAAATLG